MASSVLLILCRCLIGLLLLLTSAYAFAACSSQPNSNASSSTSVTLKAGSQRLSLYCDVSSPHVLYFPRNYIPYNQLYDADMQKIPALPGAFKSYVIDDTHKQLYLDISSQVERPISLTVSSLANFQQFESIHTFTMSLFIGFCLALSLYVGMLGTSMRNYGFYSYSFYVLSAAIFFSLQEGLLNIAFPLVTIFTNFKLHLLFAGITVFAGVKFLDHLLDFKALLKGWLRQLILGLASAGLALSVIQIILPNSDAVRVNIMLSAITLITMSFTLSSCVYASYRKVHCSNLVLAGIAVMVVLMLFRLVFFDVSNFLFQYGLVVGVTIEAFIFAIATSRKVKKLDDDRLNAFKRASTDALCNVLNRSGWEGIAQGLLSNYNKEGGYLTLLFIDVDNFKDINDQYGHHCGDKVLQVIAKILLSRCREQDAVGRLGGDEFVILSHCYSEGQSERLAARIEASLVERDIRTDNAVIPVTASVGAYITNRPCRDLTTLLNKADKQMYRVKEKHKNAELAST
ncbi:diguanylate cyclase [Alteromonas gracilis]|uniref:GGDEF domain-containing protein n=1 Tax=Alteromonas gracilis TaxID=1479524 RepID=UPI003735DD8E